MKLTRAKIAAALLLSACVGVGEMHAAARIWANTGTDFNGTGTTSFNATLAAGDVAAFNTAPTTQPNLTANLSIAGVFFNATTASGFTLSSTGGFTLTLTGNSTSGSSGTSNSSAAAIRADNTSGTNSIAANLILAANPGPSSSFVQAVGGTLAVTGNISGSSTLSLRGGGTIQLSGTNGHSGGTTINTASTSLVLGNNSALGTGALTIGNNSTVSASTTLSISNAINASGATLTIGGSNDFSTSGNFTAGGAATRAVTITNTGTTTLSGNVFLSSNATGVTTAFNGTGNLAISGQVQNDSANATVSNLTYNGTGTLTLSNASNSYTGVTTVGSGGTLSVSTLANGGSASSIGVSSNAAANLVVSGTLRYTGAAVSSDRAFTIGASGATLDASGTGALNLTDTATTTLSGTGARTFTLAGTNTGSNTLAAVLADAVAVTGTTTVNKTGDGTWVLAATNTYTGGTNINGGTLALGAAGALGTTGNVTFGGGTLQYSASNTTDHSDRIKNSSTSAIAVDTNGQTVTYAGVIDGTNTIGLVKTGAGTLVLAGDNAYTGLTTIRNGTLQLGAAQRIADTVNVVLDAIVENATATFDLNGNSETIGSLTFGGTGGNNVTNNVSTGAGVLTLGGDVSYSATGNPNAGTISGFLELGGDRNFSVGNSSNATNDLTVSAVISGTGRSLTKTGAGTLNLTGTSTYTGATNINAGTVIAAGTNSLGNGSAVTVNNGGTLFVNGSTGGSSFTIASGGTLGGSGTVGGATTVQSGGFLAPGNSPGVQTFSNGLTLDAGSTTTFEINGTGRGTTYDGIDVTGGTLTYSGALSFVFGSLISDGTTLDLFNLTNASTGTPSSIVATGSYTGSFTNDSGSWTLTNGAQQITFLQSTGDLSFAASAVPEPSTYAAIFGGAALAGVAIRRRQRKKVALQPGAVVQL